MPSTTQVLVYNLTSELVIFIFILLMILILSFYKKWRAVVELSIASGLSLIATSVIKNTFDVPRPEEALFVVSGASFPSGHATIAAAIAVFVYAAAHTNFCRKSVRFFVDFVLILFVFLVGASRVWFGVHLVPDVVAGTILGILIGFVALAVGRFLDGKSKIFKKNNKC